jgi:hypothetical protein
MSLPSQANPQRANATQDEKERHFGELQENAAQIQSTYPQQAQAASDLADDTPSTIAGSATAAMVINLLAV